MNRGGSLDPAKDYIADLEDVSDVAPSDNYILVYDAATELWTPEAMPSSVPPDGDYGDISISGGVWNIDSGVVGDSEIGTHTSTKISILAKPQLNSEIAYKDQSNTFADGMKQIFDPNATNAGINIGIMPGSSNPSSLVNGDMFILTTNVLRYGVGGSAVDVLGAGLTQSITAKKTFSSGFTYATITIQQRSDDPSTSLANGDFWLNGDALSYRSNAANKVISIVGHTHTKSQITDFAHTHVAVDVTDFDTQVRLSRLDQMAVPTTTVSLNNQKISNLLAPVGDLDAANKAYVDSVSQGLDTKASVRVATTADITLSGTQTIDGISVIADDSVLVKNQTLGQNNGIYLCKAGAWIRRTDADTSLEVNSGMYCFVSEGTTNGQNGFVLTTADPIILGTTVLVFTQFSGAGQIVAGNALSKTGNQLDVNVDGTTIEINADALRIKDLGVTYGKIQNVVSNNRILGRISGAGGSIEELTGTQVATIVDVFGTTTKGLVPAPGTISGKVLSDDGTWITPGAGSVNIKQTEIDFGSVPISSKKFTITDGDVGPTNQIIANISYDMPSDGGDVDDAEAFENITVMCRAGTGQFFLYAHSPFGDTNGKVKVNYLIG